MVVASSAVAAWCGAGAARVLAQSGSGAIVAAFSGGGYVRLDGGWVLLAPAGAPLGPLTMIVKGLEAPRAGAAAAVSGTVLTVGEQTIELQHVRAGRAPRRGERSPWARAAARAALRVAPAAPESLGPGIRSLRAGMLAAGVARLAGFGEGLTPAGDDVLAGYGAWCHADGRAVELAALAARRAAPLGLAYLECAQRGELPAVADRALDTIRAGDPIAAEAAARELGVWGASSGAALLWGIAAGAGVVSAA